jgi:hypothetical protein
MNKNSDQNQNNDNNEKKNANKNKDDFNDLDSEFNVSKSKYGLNGCLMTCSDKIAKWNSLGVQVI